MTNDIHLYILKVIKSWGNSQGFTIEKILHWSHIWYSITQGLLSKDSNVIIESCEVIRTLTLIKLFPFSQQTQASIDTVIQTIVNPSTITSFTTYLSSIHEEIVSLAISNMITSFISVYIDYITTNNGYHETLFTLLLTCTTHKPRKVAAITFDAWISIQDIPYSQRHTYLQQEIFYQLLLQLVCMHV
jgi:hypothetical protein